jgi:ParB-like chromosome segregation protein Spo0J
LAAAPNVAAEPRKGAANIEHIALERLIPYALNARLHTDAGVAAIAGSIREFGFTNPVLIDAQDGIIAGHGRVMAARKLGLETVPCIRLGYLTPAQKRAYVIADNKLAEVGSSWDEELLRVELKGLEDDGFDVSLTGFNDDELATLLRAAQDLEAIEAEAEEAKSGTAMDYLAVGKYKIPLDADELRALTDLVEAYAAESGTTFGFGGYLVRKVEGVK